MRDAGSKPPASEAATGRRSFSFFFFFFEPVSKSRGQHICHLHNFTPDPCSGRMQAETLAMHELVADDDGVTRGTSTGHARCQSCKFLKAETIATHELVAGDEAVALRTSTGQ